MADVLVFLGTTIITILIFSILALSVNLQYGSAGIFNFGVVAFFMLGAYASAFVTQAGFPFVLGAIVGGILAAIGGFLISLPAINLRGDFLALATFMFAQIIDILVLDIPALGGSIGIGNVPSAFPRTISYSASVGANLLLTGGVFVFFYIAYRLIMISPYGRVLKCIRENEVLAESLGKNTFKYKAEIFAIGSIIAGVDGAIYAQYLGFAGTELFTYSVTFTVYIMSIIGGSGTGVGALLGSAIYTSIQSILLIAKDAIALPIDPNNLLFIAFGLATVFILYYRPEGIIREKLRRVAFRT